MTCIGDYFTLYILSNSFQIVLPVCYTLISFLALHLSYLHILVCFLDCICLFLYLLVWTFLIIHYVSHLFLFYMLNMDGRSRCLFLHILLVSLLALALLNRCLYLLLLQICCILSSFLQVIGLLLPFSSCLVLYLLQSVQILVFVLYTAIFDLYLFHISCYFFFLSCCSFFSLLLVVDLYFLSLVSIFLYSCISSCNLVLLHTCLAFLLLILFHLLTIFLALLNLLHTLETLHYICVFSVVFSIFLCFSHILIVLYLVGISLLSFCFLSV